MRWDEVRHQDRAVSILRRALRSGRTHHAYLFAGPEGVGKELTARVLVARLLCTAESLEPDADPCGTCGSCRLLTGGNHPDFHLIQRSMHKLHSDPLVRKRKGLGLGIEVVREFLLKPATLKPSQSPRRVFVIREAETMNEHAENALLKTLEEPPGDACLILLTSSASRLLATIRSRCQHVPFDLLPQAYVAQELAARLGMSEEDAASLARLCGGRLGLGLRWQAVGLLEAAAEVGAAVGEVMRERPEVFAKRLLETAARLGTALQAERRAEEARGEEAAGARAADAGVEEEEEAEDEAEDAPAARSAARRGEAKIPTDALREGLRLVLALVAAVYRDGMCLAAGVEELRALPALRAVTAGLAARAIGALEQAIEGVNEAEIMVDRNVAPQLACERLAAVLRGEAQVPSV